LYAGDQTKNNEMGGTCGTYGRVEKCIYYFGAETSGKETTWKIRHKKEDNIKMGLPELS